jgi:hypothetical protein
MASKEQAEQADDERRTEVGCLDQPGAREAIGQGSGRNAQDELGQDPRREHDADGQGRPVNFEGQPGEDEQAGVHPEAAQEDRDP